MNLLGGAPYILESPIEQRAANAAIGSQAANNFLGNYWKGFAASVDERRWKEQEPLRDAQLSSAVANAEFDTTRAQMAALEAAQRSKAAVAMTDFFALKEQISDGGWEPKDRAVFYNFLSRHPEVGQTREAAEMERAFEVSDAARARLEEVNARYGMTPDGQLKIETDPTTGDRFFFSGTTWHRIPKNADPVNLARLRAAWDAINRDPVLTAEEKIAKQNEVSARFGAELVDGPPAGAKALAGNVIKVSMDELNGVLSEPGQPAERPPATTAPAPARFRSYVPQDNAVMAPDAVPFAGWLRSMGMDIPSYTRQPRPAPQGVPVGVPPSEWSQRQQDLNLLEGFRRLQ